MIARYNNISLALGVPGLLLQIIGVLAGRMNSNPGRPSLFAGVTATLGLVMLMAGFAYYAKSKGHHPVWCLLAFLSLIGLIILACLPDLAPHGESSAIGRWRGHRNDRPRRRRRRYADDDYDDEDFDDDRPRGRRRSPRRSRDDDDDFDDVRLPPSSPAKVKVEEDEVIQAEAVVPMAVTHKIVSCSKCAKSLKVAFAMAGKRVKCPSCGEVFVA